MAPSILMALLVASAGVAGAGDVGEEDTHARDIVLVVMDDIGIDRIGAYQAHPSPGRTPNLDRMAASGVRFTNVWANPVCSPTRATILTGKYSYRTYVGWFVSPLNLTPSLSSVETFIPEVIAGTYTSFAFGKWHLAKPSDLPGHPLENGFAHFSGTPFNLNGASYYRYLWYEGTQSAPGYEYATTRTTTEAIQVPSVQQGPRFLYVAYHAPHKPYERPPDHLHGFDLSGLDPGDPANSPVFQRAMIEALDTELGRLIAAYPGAIFIAVGDNGNTSAAVDGPYDPEHAKASLYQGGVQVPLVIAEFGDDPSVVTHRGVCEALVNTTDLFATVVELAGHQSHAPDSVSLVPYLRGEMQPLREHVWAETFTAVSNGNHLFHERAVRDRRFKLIRHWNTPPSDDELYDLWSDPLERTNLLEGGVPAGLEGTYRSLVDALEI